MHLERRETQALLEALKALAGRHRRFGYRRLTRLLRRRMGPVNHKRVYRLYRKHGLEVPVRRRRRHPQAPRQPMTAPQRRNECWSMDFVHDRTMTSPLRTWAQERQIEFHFTEPGKPTQAAFIESFNARLRDECLNEHVFSVVREAQEVLER